MQNVLFACNRAERFIWIELSKGAPITPSIAERFRRALERLNRESSAPVFVYLSGRGGGDFYACLKMAHAVESSASPVIVVAFKMLRSGCFFLTQVARECYAVAGAKFQFHHATDYFVKGRSDSWGMSQRTYWQKMETLRLIDAVQLLLLTRRARPISTIVRLFEREDVLNVSRARALRLVDGLYNGKEFVRIRALAHAGTTNR
jgi:hypothetical protein